jgi:hypothetical protein
MRDWIPREKIVEFSEYKILWEEILKGGSNELTECRKEDFQAAVHLNPRTITQDDYNYLCTEKDDDGNEDDWDEDYESILQDIPLEVLRICRLALLPPFTCSHIDISACDNYAIICASREGELSLVRLLLAHPRVDPAADDNYAIRWASESGNSSVVELLLADPGVDPAALDNEAIKLAYGNESVVKLLLADPRVDALRIIMQFYGN